MSLGVVWSGHSPRVWGRSKGKRHSSGRLDPLTSGTTRAVHVGKAAAKLEGDSNAFQNTADRP